mgnify:CR=1 FL=1
MKKELEDRGPGECPICGHVWPMKQIVEVASTIVHEVRKIAPNKASAARNVRCMFCGGEIMFYILELQKALRGEDAITGLYRRDEMETIRDNHPDADWSMIDSRNDAQRN